MSATFADQRTLTLTLEWTSELDAVAEKLTRQAGQPKEHLLRRLLVEALEDAEDYSTGEAALAEFRASGEQPIKASQLRRDLGLQGR